MTYKRSKVRWIILTALALAFAFGAIRLEDHYTETLIRVKVSDLDNQTIIDNAIKFAYPLVYTDLNTLRKDYSSFTPTVAHWSDYGSATLHYLKLGWGLGYFSIQLPDELVVVSADGKPVTTRNCGSAEGKCEVTPPDKPELGVVGDLMLAIDHMAEKRPITDFLAQWSPANKGRLSIKGNCFWAYTDDGRNMKLTITPTKINSVTPDYKNMFGFYEVTQELHLEKDGKGHGVGSIKRIKKEKFFAKINCKPSGS